MTAAQAFALALQHQQAGRVSEAEQICREIIAAEPNYVAAWNLLGAIACQTGRFGEAADHLRRTISLAPNLAVAHMNLGTTLQQQGQLDESIGCFTRALQLAPDDPLVHYNLANSLKQLGRLEEAIASYRRAIQLQPQFTEAYINQGAALQDQNLAAEAAICFRRAIEIQPTPFAAYNGLGIALQSLGLIDEAVDYYLRSLDLNPSSALTLNNLGNAYKDQGQLDLAIESYRRAIELDPSDSALNSNLLYALPFSPRFDAAAIYEEHRLWSERHARPLSTPIKPPAPTAASRRLRLGYVSSYFREHCQSFFTVPLFAAHDHQQFEIFCYSDVIRPDAITDRLRSYADVWRNIHAQSDENVAELIRQDQIDILVDVTMHMAGGRPLLFARQPAPIQVCWLAYPGTTGMTTIDYRLTDPYLDPPGQNDGYYSERSIRLPDTFWCYDPLTDRPSVNSLPALDNGHITFGCLNNFCKVNTDVLQLWARVLKAVDRSRLFLLAPEGSARARTLDTLQAEGVSADRIDFVVFRPRREYLALYHQIDIGLDTFPANGHTTSLDALWMGVPVVTIAGQTAVGRAGVGQLTNLGLQELIADSPDQFVSIASELAADLPRLSALRASLRHRLQNSPLMDGPRFARNIEAAFRSMAGR